MTKNDVRSLSELPAAAPSRRARSFARSNTGTAAIEFALAAPVFLMLVFGIFEVGINYMADRMLNAGVDSVARKIKTGEIRSSPTYGLTEFKEELCKEDVMFLFDCNKLYVDVQTVGSFQENKYDTDADGNLVTKDFGFSPGGRTTINVVRAFYEWPTVINWTDFAQGHGYTLDAFGDGARLIVASSAFLNEPYS